MLTLPLRMLGFKEGRLCKTTSVALTNEDADF